MWTIILFTLSCSALVSGQEQSFTVGGSLRACDQVLEDNIKARWAGKEPTNLIESAVKEGKHVLLLTTTGFYENISNVFLHTHIEQETGYAQRELYRIPLHGCGFQFQQYYLEESAGELYIPANHISMIPIFHENGVSAWYYCSRSPYADQGPPQGILKVATYYDKPKVNEAIEAAQYCGIFLTDYLKPY